MTCRTTKEASKLICPIARLSGADPITGECKADKCMFWNWRPISADDPRVLSAIVREKAILRGEAGNEKKSDAALHREAVARVNRDPDAFTFPTDKDKGWCGLSGRAD